MKVVKTVKEVREIVSAWRKEGLSVGFVPTMGYLHEGHQSLIIKSARQNDRTVVSVFVNPIQFGPNEDLEAYPRDLNRDMQKVEEAGGDLIFNPEPAEMYPGHFTSNCSAVLCVPFISVVSVLWWVSFSTSYSPTGRTSDRRMPSSWQRSSASYAT